MGPIERAVEAAWVEAERQSQEQCSGLRVVQGELDMDGVVRAVIAAIREPSEVMVAAGEATGAQAGDWMPGFYVAEPDASWPAMIDKLLEEGQ